MQYRHYELIFVIAESPQDSKISEKRERRAGEGISIIIYLILNLFVRKNES